jgi:alpha-galactosidase
MKRLLLLLVLMLASSVNAHAQKFAGLAATPQMGWNSWNTFACDINEQLIRDTADSMIKLGLKDAGYEYVNIDDCWHGKRDEHGVIHPDAERFPSGIKALADYVHNKGLKLGIYSDAGATTCGGRPGSRGHEYQDAKTYADWGIDYVKYDWCDTKGLNAAGAYTTMRDAIRAAGRPMLFSICEWGDNKPWDWAADIGHSWRTTGDIYPCWDCELSHSAFSRYGVMRILDRQAGLRKYAGPGHWNDMDMLEVGMGMSEDEDRAHFAIWAMLASPLILGNDLRKMPESTRRILTNKDVIAISQDKAGIQGWKFLDDGKLEYWAKPQANNEWALMVLNRGEQAVTLNYDWKAHQINDDLSKREMDFKLSVYDWRDAWSGKTGDTSRKLDAKVAPHGALVLRLKPQPVDGAACSTTPAPRKLNYHWMSRERWHQMFQEDVEVADKGGVDLLFVGDSITEGWNKDVWERSFGSWRAANFGIGGDHTGNVLWRLQNGHAEKLHPKTVVLTIGVNNFSFCNATPEQALDGIKLVVAQLRKLYPDASILLNALLPHGQSPQSVERARVLELNRKVATLNDGQHIFFHDYGNAFLKENGELSADIMGDFLHPTSKGYQIWADAMLPDIRKLMSAGVASITAADPQVSRMGRAETRADGSVRFGYPGVSFYLNFEGTRLNAVAQASGTNSYLDVIVDGKARRLRLKEGLQTQVLAEGLVPGKHSVEIVNRTETWQGTAALLSFDTDGRWAAAPALPDRKLLVLGDSVTCGAAIDRVAGEKGDASWGDPLASFGMLMARQLNAQVQLVCYGGRGLIRTWEGKTNDMNLADYYRMAIPTQPTAVPWNQRDYRPDAILVAIGTNDMTTGIPEQEQYVQAYVSLVRTLLQEHPQAQIMLTEGGILSGAKQAALTAYIKETVRRTGDAHVHAIASTSYPGDATNSHPTREQHVSIVNDLLPQVRSVMRW